MTILDTLKAALHQSQNNWEIEIIDSVDSTNAELSRRYHPVKTVPNLILWAETQNKGRGRLNRQWFSAPGKDITASIIFPSPSKKSLLSILTFFPNVIFPDVTSPPTIFNGIEISAKTGSANEKTNSKVYKILVFINTYPQFNKGSDKNA